MNLNIINYGPYRVTDYGRAGISPSLYNRRTGSVIEITKEDFQFIINPEESIKINSTPEIRCSMIERNYSNVCL